MVLQESHHVTCASDGHEALRELGKGGYDLAVLEDDLPGMTGREALRVLRDLHGATPPVLMVSSLGDPDDLRDAVDAGVDRHLAKPFTRVQFRAAVLELIGDVA